MVNDFGGLPLLHKQHSKFATRKPKDVAIFGHDGTDSEEPEAARAWRAAMPEVKAAIFTN